MEDAIEDFRGYVRYVYASAACFVVVVVQRNIHIAYRM